MRWLVCAWMLLGCGRIGFDDGGDDDGPAAGVELDFRACGALPSGVTFARNSPATYFDASGALRTAAPGQPRCSYDATGKPRGLLVEPASTNENEYSRGDGMDTENFPQNWQSQHETSVTVNAVVADSTTFAGAREVTITTANADSGDQYWQVLIDSSVSGGGTYTMSWYARSSDPSGIRACTMFAVYFTPNYTVQLGRTPESADEMPTATWKRYIYTLDAPPTIGEYQMYFECIIRSGMGFTLTLAAPQLEVGPIATTPIITTGAKASRAADIVTLPTSLLEIDDSSTVVVDVDVAAEAPGKRRIALASGDTATTTMFRIAHESGSWNASDNNDVAGMQGAALGAHRVGYRFAPGAGTFVLDGTMAPGMLGGLMGSITALGADHIGVDSLIGTLARVRAWPDALDDTALVEVTR